MTTRKVGIEPFNEWVIWWVVSRLYKERISGENKRFQGHAR